MAFAGGYMHSKYQWQKASIHILSNIVVCILGYYVTVNSLLAVMYPPYLLTSTNSSSTQQQLIFSTG